MKKGVLKYVALALAAALLVAVLACVIIVRVEGEKIPKLYFEGDISAMYEKSDVRNISVKYDDGQRVIDGFAEIKVQGTSSLGYEKKNYTIKFYADAEHEDKLKIDVGWGEQSKYCLKANWIDRTHARNIITANIAAEAQAKYGVLTDTPHNGTIDGFPVEIYSNGEFLGLYTFNIPKDAWQFNMDEDDPNHIVLCSEGHADANHFLAEPNFEDWSVEVGEESEETLEKAKLLFDFVMNSTDEEFKAGFEEHLDLDSALNYYVIADFAYLPDNLDKNMLLVTYDGMKWYLSLYDLDTSWGADYNGKTVYDYANDPLNLSINNLFARMEACFSEELAQRYFELREEILTRENVMGKFEAFEDLIPAYTFVKEAARWGVGTFKTHSDLPGFDYDQIEDYLDTVIDGLDAKYADMLGQ